MSCLCFISMPFMFGELVSAALRGLTDLQNRWSTGRGFIHTYTLCAHGTYGLHTWSARPVWAVIYFGWTWAADHRNLEMNHLSGICAQWRILIGMNGIAPRNAVPTSPRIRLMKMFVSSIWHISHTPATPTTDSWMWINTRSNNGPTLQDLICMLVVYDHGTSSFHVWMSLIGCWWISC